MIDILYLREMQMVSFAMSDATLIQESFVDKG